jgi:hypothetical protein
LAASLRLRVPRGFIRRVAETALGVVFIARAV